MRFLLIEISHEHKQQNHTMGTVMTDTYTVPETAIFVVNKINAKSELEAN